MRGSTVAVAHKLDLYLITRDGSLLPRISQWIIVILCFGFTVLFSLWKATKANLHYQWNINRMQTLFAVINS